MSFISFLTHLHHLPGLVRKLEQWDKGSTEVNVMITGKTGTGKTTLINSLLGTNQAIEGFSLDPQTKEVEKFEVKLKDSARLSIWDSPGLQDGTINEQKYLADIKKRQDSIDLYIYCIRMSDTRFVPDNPDVIAMKKLTKELGGDWWRNVIIVLTFANDLVELAEEDEMEGYMRREYEEWKGILHDRLKNEVLLPVEVIEQIPIVPAACQSILKIPSYKENTGEYYWLTDVWLQALSVTKIRAQPALIRINAFRMHYQEESYTENDKSLLRDSQPLIFLRKGEELSRKICGHSHVVGKMAGLIAGLKSATTVFLCAAQKNRIIDYKDVEDYVEISA